MRKHFIEDELEKTMKKLYKKDKVLYSSIMHKIKDILDTENVDHYKNLRKPLQEFKRVHITNSFVLIFKYLKSEDKVIFYKFVHRDNAYK